MTQVTHAAGQRAEMNQASGEKAKQLHDTNEKLTLEMREMELERDSLKKKVKELQASCTYYEGKQQSSTNELQTLRMEHEVNMKNSLQMKRRLDTLKKENEELQDEVRLLRSSATLPNSGETVNLEAHKREMEEL